MKISFIPTGLFKLDGGAMFGVVPKKIWKHLNPPDDNNLCTWAMRCLLIETGDRKILVDTGIGDKQDTKWRSYFEPHGEDSLLNSLAAKGFRPEEITDVFLTHLHFDHCGGALKLDEKGRPVPVFPNAVHWSNEVHWKWATAPNERERASFLKENFIPLKEQCKVQFIDVQRDILEWLPGVSIQFLYGHTEAMMALHLDNGGNKLIYCTDLMPSSFHIGMPYVLAYDVRPLVTLEEKEVMLADVVDNDWTLLFEHDPVAGCAKLMRTDSGRIILKEKFDLV